ncbi:MAG: hypothetical protein ACAI43_13445 [Phycisphaerae bacterium]|nr:hypothetical protein [Tepidisphaeraceae bacterium]
MTDPDRGPGDPPPPGDPGSEIRAGLWSVYYRRGYDDGYRQAVQDVLGLLVFVSEEFLGANGPTDDPRRLIYAYERHLERQIERLAGHADPGRPSGRGAPPAAPEGLSDAPPS